MATAVIYSKTGAKKETPAKLNAKVFGVEANHDLVGLAYRSYLANGRSAGAKTLTRGEVRGGGKKPHKQKGTGRARAGSSRIVQWRGGGVVFGPTGLENHSLNLPVKAKRAAIRQALSLQAIDNKVLMLEAFDGGEGRVKPTIALLDKLKIEGSILLVVAEKTPTVDRATRNIAGLQAVSAKYLNVYTIMNADWIVITNDAVDVLNTWLEDK
ncbi:MAG TPA: 50S ribosomal protein L4 [Candidatus Saccharimonadales bacterium]|nr:50S ribosomal protein L4 [Candidatus Saccharimonadales bacterium]